MEFENGAAMYAHDFDKNYSIKSISIRNEKVVVELEEWQQNNIVWIGEEAIQLQETSLGVVKVV